MRLGTRTRKVVLVGHIVSVSAWIGIDLALGVLVLTATITADTATAATAFQAAHLIAVWPMLTASLLSLATGVTLALGTKYGLIRYWWVAVKLAINLAMTTLIYLSLRPGLYAAAEHGRRLAAGDPATQPPEQLIYPIFVAPSLLLAAVVLSVFKPWGRTSRRGDTAQPRRYLRRRRAI
ncbi:hypothetical protein ACIBEJ_38340 [Nonomuraea sp. NPDC050790]|uniref:hypothetical protein n=1 Tax=Nonomuraea sp. NPDC050790 TaxID=3364371 RepID=UPI00379C3D82